MKQYELAKKAYITPLTLVRIENNRTSPHSSTLAVIADALGVSVDELKGEGHENI
ncbi:MAG: helix-turn-helix transcriptional regulator [Candidatus Paceibacterota bacterium]